VNELSSSVFVLPTTELVDMITGTVWKARTVLQFKCAPRQWPQGSRVNTLINSWPYNTVAALCGHRRRGNRQIFTLYRRLWQSTLATEHMHIRLYTYCYINIYRYIVLFRFAEKSCRTTTTAAIWWVHVLCRTYTESWKSSSLAQSHWVVWPVARCCRYRY